MPIDNFLDTTEQRDAYRAEFDAGWLWTIRVANFGTIDAPETVKFITGSRNGSSVTVQIDADTRDSEENLRAMRRIKRAYECGCAL